MNEKQSVCLTKLVQPVDLIDQKYITQDSKITEELIAKLIKLKQVSEFKNVLEGAKRGLTAYQKPEGGIPMSDLARDLQELITRLESLTQDSTDFGQVTYDSSTKRINFYSANDINLENVLGSLDVTKFQTMLSGDTGVSLDDVMLLIEPRAKKSEMSVLEVDDATYITLKQGTTARVINRHQSLDKKQDVLVDEGQNANFKTIENQSLLGPGNITISKSDWNITDEYNTGYIKNKPTARDSKLVYKILPPIVLDRINQPSSSTTFVPDSMIGKVYHTNNNKIVRYVKINNQGRAIQEDLEEGLVYFNKDDGKFYRYGEENPGEDKKMIEITTAGEPGGNEIYAYYDSQNERLVFYTQSGVLIEGECLTLS